MYVGWGTAAQDFDRDGDEDIFVSNGHVIRYHQNTAMFQVPLLLENEAGRRLLNRADQAGPWLKEQHMGRGAVAADFDGDGDPDLAISRTRQPAAVLENASPPVRKRWLSVRLVGLQSSRDPVGATIRLIAGPGNIQSRFIRGGGSYGSSQSSSVHFAVPDDATGAQLEIQWPSGQNQTLLPEWNQRITVVEGR
jgi:hypothetical protein